MTPIRKLGVLTATLGFATVANAHYVWVEPADGGLAMRFGYFGENLRETSPGRLDGFGKPVATLLSAKGDKAVQVSKAANGFALPVAASQGDTIVAEDAVYPLRKSTQAGKEVTNWYHPGARLITGFTAAQPKLALDLVPTGGPGEFKLFFKGQPLPKTRVSLFTQSGWSRVRTSDEQGLVSFDMPWQGQYVATVNHTDPTPGERNGEKYDSVGYATTLTYVKADGVAPIPAAPVRLPSK